MKRTGMLFVALLPGAVAASGQGTFGNLDFELATVPASQPPSTFNDQSTWVGTAIAVPSWTTFVGANQFTSVLYNNYTIGTASISLFRSNAVSTYGDTVIEGRFGVLLQAGLYDFNRTEVSLRQTGLVPASAQSMLFKAFQSIPSTARPFEVSLGGQVLDLLPLQTASTYTLYGADISQFANQNAELRFTAFTLDGGLNNLNIDSIMFSNQPIPEPRVFGLFALGALLLGWRFVRARR